MSWFNVVLLNLRLVNLCANTETPLSAITILFFLLNSGLLLAAFALASHTDGLRARHAFWG